MKFPQCRRDDMFSIGNTNEFGVAHQCFATGKIAIDCIELRTIADRTGMFSSLMTNLFLIETTIATGRPNIT